MNRAAERLTVAMIGRQYRLVWSTVVAEEAIERPYDDRVFDSVHVARAELQRAKGN